MTNSIVLNGLSRHFATSLGAAILLLLGNSTYAVPEDSRLKRFADSLENSREATRAAQELQSDSETRLLDVLGEMKNRSAVAKNWLLAVAQTVADRDRERAIELLTQFLPRLSEDPTARYWAFSYITQGDSELREELLESMLADPSLDLRFEAVELGVRRLADSKELTNEMRVSRYRELLSAARLPEQVQSIAERLEELGSPVNLQEHFGFLSTWKVLGTFDNTGQEGFDVAYAPEQDYTEGKLDLQGTYSQQAGRVEWRVAKTEAADGSLDLNPIFDQKKGAIVYAYSKFVSPADLDCEVRIGSPNACKVWVNGDLVVSREVYHSGNQIDQYVEPVKLRAGKNSVLVKVCQNEQTEPWAQDWLFQLRFTDDSGLAIQPAE